MKKQKLHQESEKEKNKDFGTIFYGIDRYIPEDQEMYVNGNLQIEDCTIHNEGKLVVAGTISGSGNITGTGVVIFDL